MKKLFKRLTRMLFGSPHGPARVANLSPTQPPFRMGPGWTDKSDNCEVTIKECEVIGGAPDPDIPLEDLCWGDEGPQAFKWSYEIHNKETGTWERREGISDDGKILLPRGRYEIRNLAMEGVSEQDQ